MVGGASWLSPPTLAAVVDGFVDFVTAAGAGC